MDRQRQAPHADPPLIVRASGPQGFVRANPSFRERVGYEDDELAAEGFLEWLAPRDRDTAAALIGAGEGSCRVNHKTRSGEWIPLEVQVSRENGETMLLGRCAVASGTFPAVGDEDEHDVTVKSTLTTIARIIEAQNPGYRCSILLVAEGRFVSGAGPSLPEEYNAAIDGYAIGPAVGSCGTAIYWNVPIIVEDIQADPLWAPFAELASKAGVGACWSHPFTSSQGRVLGALAFYAPEPRTPTPEQLSRLKAAARLTGLAVERGRAEEALREQRRREQELEEQLRQAAKMEALGVLAGGIAHDFNNILAIMRGNAELAMTLLPPSTKIAPMLSDIVNASQRAGSLCSQMLAYAGRGLVTSSRFEIGVLLLEMRDLIQSALSKKATLELRTLNDEPIVVEGDENQLLQVVMNLVTNAAEALEEQAGTITVISEVVRCDEATLQKLAPQEQLAAGEYARITVRDTGKGMDPKTMERIFDPFFTTKFTGRGLGLAAVRGIVRRHSGAIQLESVLDEGTTFRVLLPLAAGAVDAEDPAASAPSLTSPRSCVLVVDDEDDLRRVYRRLLEFSGYEVLEASDGEKALELFRQDPQRIDCVLLDLSMPKLSGDETRKELHALRPELPIVIMSGFSEQELLWRFEGGNLAGALKKPIASARLLETIRRATAS